MSTDPTIMAQAIADRLIEILSASRELDAVRAFVRGGTPVTGLAIDQHPFCEVWVASEDTDGELTGAIDELTYTGAVSFVLQMADRIEPDGDRLYHLASYDEIKRLAYHAIRELSHRRWHDLDGLATQDETVSAFYLAGAREYGIDPVNRRDNFNQTAIIPFLVETERRAAVEQAEVIPEEGTNGYVVLLFADGHLSAYTLAYDLLNNYLMPAANMIPVAYVGGVGRMTAAQLDELNAAGWDNCSHGYTGGDPTRYSDAELDYDLKTAHEWLEGRGYLGARIYGPPAGRCDQRVHDAAYIDPAIPGDLGYYNMICNGFVTNEWSDGFPDGYIYHGTSGAEAKGWDAIQAAIDQVRGASDHVTQINFHDIVLADPIGPDTSLAFLTRVVEYLDANDIQVVTFSQLYDGTIPS